ncbi:hypothetical protein EDD91_8150 [Streptomyces sp. KS 21]|nr:hypothetical protein EDD91_8150 [Streptomyces sp. KS 21]
MRENADVAPLPGNPLAGTGYWAREPTGSSKVMRIISPLRSVRHPANSFFSADGGRACDDA